MEQPVKIELPFDIYRSIASFEMRYMLDIKSDDCVALPVNPFYSDNSYTSLRRLKLIALSSAFKQINKFVVLTISEKIDFIKRIEVSCLNETIRKSQKNNVRCTWDNPQFVIIYHSICYNILSYIDDGESSMLIEKMFSGEIDINNIASMSCQELCPEKYEELSQLINKRSNLEHKVKFTKLHFCTKCKTNHTTSKRVQNRSNDEGSSFYITCLYCGNKWFGG